MEPVPVVSAKRQKKAKPPTNFVGVAERETRRSIITKR